MSEGEKLYCLDANVLIQAANGPYKFNIAPTFWDWLKTKCDEGAIKSSKLIYDEVVKGEDEVASWISDNWNGDIAPEPSEKAQKLVTEIGDYVVDRYQAHSVRKFLSGADPWIIAQAKDDGAVIVTHESKVAENSTKIKIPNICEQFDVPYTDLYTMLQDLNFRM